MRYYYQSKTEVDAVVALRGITVQLVVHMGLFGISQSDIHEGIELGSYTIPAFRELALLVADQPKAALRSLRVDIDDMSTFMLEVEYALNRALPWSSIDVPALSKLLQGDSSD